MRAGSRRGAALAGLLLFAAGCSGEGAGPSERRVELRVYTGDEQFGVPSQSLADPLEVLVTDAATGAPVDRISVTWRSVTGGGVVTVQKAESDEFGIARASLRMGADTGSHVVEASAERQTNAPARFTSRAIRAPQLEANPILIAAAGSTIELAGSGFHPTTALNVVRFGGVRGAVLASTATRLTVRVPGCVADRATVVAAEIGGVRSNTIVLQGQGPGAQAPLRLEVGEARRLTSAAAFGCLRLAGEPGAEYLLLTQHTATRASPPTPFELVGFADPLPLSPAVTVEPDAPASIDRASTFELSLRVAEAAWAGWAPPPADRAAAAQAAVASVPAVGERASFRVLKADRTFTTVTAEVRRVSAHAILYQDVKAPAAGLTTADFERLGALFDDPIHATTTDVFGQPSDIDGNGRVIILFTPAVNDLTDASDQGFIAGYFYGCDLLDRQRCSGSNRAEIFYSMVPDPNGVHGRRHTVAEVMRSVPAVLAHEYQHMIHFAQKGSQLDDLWLSEGLAHAAEDVVADVLAARGEHLLAAEFRSSNYLRGRYFLQSPGSSGLLAEVVPGTLAMRGGAWLLVKYLMGHHGGTDLLGALTRTSQSGAANVVARVGRPWGEILADFGVALFADGLDAPVAHRQTFTNFAPRTALRTAGAYPLAIQGLTPSGFARQARLGASGSDYALIRVPTAGGAPVHVTLSGLRGGDFAAGAEPQLTVLRIR